jgi:sec-independent protein translocase protein TatA
MNLGPMEIGLLVLAVMLLFGYKKLPDASRSLGQSLRTFKAETQEMGGQAAADWTSPSGEDGTAMPSTPPYEAPTSNGFGSSR